MSAVPLKSKRLLFTARKTIKNFERKTFFNNSL